MSDIVIGLTGGIGSGKTAASDYFEALEIEVIDADVVARFIVEPPSPALDEIAKHFGAESIKSDGTLNRPYMRELIFKDDEQKKLLEAITHPLIREEIVALLKAAKSTYCLLVSPLLFEMDQQQLCTRTLLIDCPESMQIQRASVRDSNTEESIKRIIDSQMSRSQKHSLADDVITNDKGMEDLYEQIDKFNQEYLDI